MSSEAICPLSVIPSRMAARMRSSVVSDESERGVNRNSGCSSSLTCPIKLGKISRKELSNDW